MRRFYENWPDLKNLIPKLHLKNDDDVRPKLLEAMNSIEKNAVGRFEMISEVLKLNTARTTTGPQSTDRNDPSLHSKPFSSVGETLARVAHTYHLALHDLAGPESPIDSGPGNLSQNDFFEMAKLFHSDRF